MEALEKFCLSNAVDAEKKNRIANFGEYLSRDMGNCTEEEVLGYWPKVLQVDFNLHWSQSTIAGLLPYYLGDEDFPEVLVALRGPTT